MALTARVETALRQNPYIYAEHITVTTDRGVVRVGGVVRDLPELFAILRVARRIAGKGRVVNEIQFLQVDQDGN
jgi:osmotically-inducible protein OsmY